MSMPKFTADQIVAAFRAAAAADGLELPAAPIADGGLHRIPAVGRPGRKDDYYTLHLDGMPAGAYGSFLLGVHRTWSARGFIELSGPERAAQAAHIATQKAVREKAVAQAHERAARAAHALLARALPATTHPYLAAKRVEAHGVALHRDGSLLVPMRDAQGVLHNVERICPNDFARKISLPGGRRRGLMHRIGPPSEVMVLCEGYATGASLFEALNVQVVAAFNASNLCPVAFALREQQPATRLVLAADDDWQRSPNVGLQAAHQAAAAVGALVVVPRFGPNRRARDTDFNDLHQRAGLQSVRQCFAHLLEV